MSSTKVQQQDRAKAIAAKLKAAENVRCACGCHGSWERPVHGASGPANAPCTWAGCSNPSHRGQALGIPIADADLAWYRSYVRRHPDAAHTVTDAHGQRWIVGPGIAEPLP